MAKLKVIHTIWNKKNPIAAGSSFECNDQREVDRLVSSGAAIIDEPIVDPVAPLSSEVSVIPDLGITDETTIEIDTVDIKPGTLSAVNEMTNIAVKSAVIDTVESEPAYKIAGIDDTVVKTLIAAGIGSIEKAKQLTKEQLVAVPGLGYNNAQKVFKALK